MYASSIDDLERRVKVLEEQVAAIQGDHYLDRLSDQADRIKALEDASPKPPEQKHGEVIAEAAGRIQVLRVGGRR